MAPIILQPPFSDGAPKNASRHATPGPYERDQTLPWTHVPSLAYFCIRRLVDYPEYAGRVSLPYVPPETEGDPDILRTLVPSYSYFDNTLDYNALDPRLWAVIVQLFDGLPSIFSTYSLALNDKHLPLLQRVECTEHFSLVVVLDLSGSPNLTDGTVQKLFELRHLAALDISKTRISALGVKLLRPRTSATDGHEGPRALRVLSLRGCRAVDDDVLGYLRLFPLLSVIGTNSQSRIRMNCNKGRTDIRDTACCGRIPKSGASSFRPCSNAKLFYPTPHDIILANLRQELVELYSSSNVYTLSVAQERYPASQQFPTADELRDDDLDARELLTATEEGDAPEVTDQLLGVSSARSTTKAGDAFEKDQIETITDDVDSLLNAPEVAEDSREFASRLNARQFYGVPNNRPSRHRPSTSYRTSARVDPSAKHRHEIEDPRFTLYRPPPPYSSLSKSVEKSRPPAASRSDPRSSAAGRTDLRLDPALLSSGKDAVSKAAQDFLVARKRPRLDPAEVAGLKNSFQSPAAKTRATNSSSTPAASSSFTPATSSSFTPATSTVTKKANPFAAKRGSGPSSRLQPSSSSRPVASSSSSSHPSPSKPMDTSPPKNTSLSKPLTPISALPRPEFPPDEIAKNAREAAKAMARDVVKKEKSKEKKDKGSSKPEKQFDWTTWSRKSG
ncbi:hypothetical protein EV121DRAFT_218239 [Schizophyllum commune]